MLLVCAVASLPAAQAASTPIVTERSLDETKAEVIHRAQESIYPLVGMSADDVRSAVANVKSLDRDEWANAFIAAGDKYMKDANAQLDKEPEKARKNFQTAQKLYYFGRWPAPLDSAARSESYKKEREAFLAGTKLNKYTVEKISGFYKGKPVPALLGLPKTQGKAPVVVAIGGLDGWKESRFTQFASLLGKGVAVLAIDKPGTGESPARLEKGAVNSLISVLDEALKRNDLDASRVVIYGGSFGGYWSTMLAVDIKDRLKGVVSQSGPFDVTFHPETFSAVMTGDEYLYDAYPAMFELLADVHSPDDFFRLFRQQSLTELGYNTKPTSDMLIIGGKLDTLVPTADILNAMAMPGGIKDVWFNPTGIHMGRDRQRRIFDADINDKVIYPWILEKLGVSEK